MSSSSNSEAPTAVHAVNIKLTARNRKAVEKAVEFRKAVEKAVEFTTPPSPPPPAEQSSTRCIVPLLENYEELGATLAPLNYYDQQKMYVLLNYKWVRGIFKERFVGVVCRTPVASSNSLGSLQRVCGKLFGDLRCTLLDTDAPYYKEPPSPRVLRDYSHLYGHSDPYMTTLPKYFEKYVGTLQTTDVDDLKRSVEYILTAHPGMHLRPEATAILVNPQTPVHAVPAAAAEPEVLKKKRKAPRYRPGTVAARNDKRRRLEEADASDASSDKNFDPDKSSDDESFLVSESEAPMEGSDYSDEDNASLNSDDSVDSDASDFADRLERKVRNGIIRLNKTADRLKNRVKDKDFKIERLERKLKRRDATIVERDRELRKRDEDISEKDKEIKRLAAKTRGLPHIDSHTKRK